MRELPGNKYDSMTQSPEQLRKMEPLNAGRCSEQQGLYTNLLPAAQSTVLRLPCTVHIQTSCYAALLRALAARSDPAGLVGCSAWWAAMQTLHQAKWEDWAVAAAGSSSGQALTHSLPAWLPKAPARVSGSPGSCCSTTGTSSRKALAKDTLRYVLCRE